jgi:hypothetical protein
MVMRQLYRGCLDNPKKHYRTTSRIQWCFAFFSLACRPGGTATIGGHWTTYRIRETEPACSHGAEEHGRGEPVAAANRFHQALDGHPHRASEAGPRPKGVLQVADRLPRLPPLVALISRAASRSW